MSENYVSVAYRGGLGNQISNFFTMLSYALDHGKTPVLRYSKESPSITKRSTYFDTFFKELTNFSSEIKFDHTLKEHRDDRRIELPYRDGNVLLEGYFHCHGYYYHNLERIIALLDLDAQRDEIREKYAELLSSESPTVAVHFRLGDYKKLPQYHPIITPQYYKNCLTYLQETVGTNLRFLYFCEPEDDERIVREYLPIFDGCNIVKVPNTLSDVEQLLLMSCCTVNIIANSTFSFWAAMISRNKTVLYPSRCFHDSTSTDFCPPTWIRVDRGT